MSNSLIENNQSTNKSYPDSAKIFVGGLARDTTDDDLKDYFSSFGTVVECNLKRDFASGASRGFAFVTFDDPSSVETVVSKMNHSLGGKMIDPKKLKTKDLLEKVTKVFVGGVDPNTSENEIREYFQQYGKIESMDLPFDKEKNQRRGFCFINFDSSDAVDALCTKPKHPLGNKEVEVKKATPQDTRMNMMRMGLFRGPYGGGGDFMYRPMERGMFPHPPMMSGYGSYNYNNFPPYFPPGNQGQRHHGNYNMPPQMPNNYNSSASGQFSSHQNSHAPHLNGYSIDPYSPYAMNAGGQRPNGTINNSKNNRSSNSYERYN